MRFMRAVTRVQATKVSTSGQRSPENPCIGSLCSIVWTRGFGVNHSILATKKWEYLALTFLRSSACLHFHKWGHYLLLSSNG